MINCSTISWLIVALNTLIVFGVSIPQIFVNWREMRTQRAMRLVYDAYEKELLERGVKLPPRCVRCLQILPEHVEGCHLVDRYMEMHRVIELLTRPTIKYYPKGERPPHR